MKVSTVRYELVTRAHDIEKMCDTIVLALKDSSYSDFTPNREKLEELIETCYANENEGKRYLMLALDGEKHVGIVGAMLIEDHFLLGRVGQEILWWVDPGYRKSKIASELLESLETWAKFIDTKHLLMGHYENEYAPKMRKMYEKNGFQLKEYNYYKEIK